MNINPPAKIRKALYIVTGLVNILMLYLSVKGYVGEAETAAWASLNLFISGLAGYNVSDTTEEK